MKKKKNSSKPAEDKRTKFKRVVTPRVQKALKFIRLIGNQSGSAYSYSQDDIANIMTALRLEIDAVEKRYQAKGTDQADFSLE